MNTLNLKELISTVRSKSDLEQSDFVTDEEITSYLNLAYTHLYNMIVDCNQDFFLNSHVFKTPNYPAQLPVDCYKVRALDYYISDRFFVSARPIGFNERQIEQSDFYRPYLFSDRFDDPMRYSLRGRELKIYSHDEWSGDLTFVLWYIPKPQKVGEGAQLPFGWERYVIHSACLDVRNKQDTSTREFERLLMRDKEDIMSACQRKDYNGNPMIQDVEGDTLDDIYENKELFLSEFVDEGTNAALSPSLGDKTYLPQDFTDFKVSKRHVAYYGDTGKAVVGMELPRGMSSDFGNWIIVFLFKDSGNVYLTARSNPQYIGLEDAWAAMPLEFNIDSEVYRDMSDFYGARKLYYNENIVYLANVADPQDPPQSSLFSTSNRVGLLPYWTIIPSGIQPRQASELIYQNRGENTQAVPLSDEDAYLLLAIKAPRDPKGIYFDNDPVNQIGAFQKQGEQGGIKYYVSLNSFQHDSLAETVRVVI